MKEITGFSFSELQSLSSNAKQPNRATNDNSKMTPAKSNYIVNRLKDLGCEGVTHRYDPFTECTLFYVKNPFGGFAIAKREDKVMHGAVWRQMVELRIQEYLDKCVANGYITRELNRLKKIAYTGGQ